MKEAKMPILNYTTTIDAFKTANEIESILVKHHALSIMKNYEQECIKSMSFIIDTGYAQIPIKLPAKTEGCLKVLKAEKKAGMRSIKDTRASRTCRLSNPKGLG